MILIGEDGNEIVSSNEGWPSISVDVDGQTVERPAIQVID